MGEQLTGWSPNPIALTRLREALRLWGLGERTLKTALAASIAWELGALVPGGTAHPYFAPLAALLSMQITVAESIAGAAQRVAGIVAGVGVAMVVTRITGASAPGIGLLVLLSLVVGARLRLGPQAVSQVAISALLVMFVGNASSFSYAGSRIVESIVGALVGVAVNALLIPPSTLPQALKARQTLGEAVAAALHGLASALSDGLTLESAARSLSQARALSAPRAAAAAEMDRARTSLRYNMRRRAQLAAMARLEADNETLEHAVIQTRTLARALGDALAENTKGEGHAKAGEGETTPRWPALASLDTAVAALIDALATSVERFAGSPGGPSPDLGAALAEAARRRHAVDLAVRAGLPKLTPDAWMRLGALLASADRMWADLSEAARPDRAAEPDAD
jgi:uncharacterized membrane protein YgaE (UPF0421/DUF939 family)